MEAYVSGLEKAAANGHELADIHSVASFFVSRVDTEIDKRLEATTEGPGTDPDLRGKAGVANARLAFQVYEEFFAGERWEALEAQGARKQRPLWASTGRQEPRLRRHHVRRRPRRRGHRQHDAREDPRRRGRPRRGAGRPRPPVLRRRRRPHEGARGRRDRLRRRDRGADRGGRREVRRRVGRAPDHAVRVARGRAAHDGGRAGRPDGAPRPGRAWRRWPTGFAPDLRRVVRRGPGAASPRSPSPAGDLHVDLSKIAPRRPTSSTPCSTSPSEVGCGRAARRDVRRRAHQRHRGPRGAPHRAAAARPTRR